MEDDYWANLKDKPFPSIFAGLTNTFLTIWEGCEVNFGGQRVLRFTDIKDYCEITGVKLNHYEGRLLLKMRRWAQMGISKLKEETDE